MRPENMKTRQEHSEKQNALVIDESSLLNRVPFSKRTLFNLRTTGKLPYIKLGRRILYHLPTVEEALRRQQRNVLEGV